MIDNGPGNARIVQLKAGRPGPCLFLVPGTGGSIEGFATLAADLRTPMSVFAIEARGIDESSTPDTNVEEMALHYLARIRTVQGAGPYFLAGHSFGGLVALEMAQSLHEVGEDVGLLALIDAYPDARYMLPAQRLRLRAQRVGSRVADLQQRSVRAGITYVARRLKHRLRVGDAYVEGNSPSGASRLSFEHTTLRVKQKAYVALERYSPQLYGGKIKFVKSESDSYYPADPAAVWAKLAAGFESETVRGGHLDMLTGDIKSLAAVLTRYMNEALEIKTNPR